MKKKWLSLLITQGVLIWTKRDGMRTWGGGAEKWAENVQITYQRDTAKLFFMLVRTNSGSSVSEKFIVSCFESLLWNLTCSLKPSFFFCFQTEAYV